MSNRRPETDLVRAGLERSRYLETAEPLYLTSGYVYESAAEAEAAFAGEVDRYIYSRYGNPTVAIFEERLRLLEGAEACQATGSGMGAVFTAMAATLRTGDRVVAARDLFGSCYIVLDELLPRWGIETEFVDGSDTDQWADALSREAALVFFETPSNPMQQLVDIETVAELAHAAGAQVMVDNVFATPLGQQPLALGADIVVHSATKHVDGQGRALGGAICASEEFIHGDLRPFVRHTGPAMSPFNAWLLAKSLETMPVRVGAMAAAASALADWLSQHDRVVRVIYPGHFTHPQHDLARRQMSMGGTVVTIELEGGKPESFRFLDALELIDISNNLGDAKSLATHPASTTHRRLGEAVRAAMGITDAIVRISVGLEHLADLQEDVDRALLAS